MCRKCKCEKYYCDGWCYTDYDSGYDDSYSKEKKHHDKCHYEDKHKKKDYDEKCCCEKYYYEKCYCKKYPKKRKDYDKY